MRNLKDGLLIVEIIEGDVITMLWKGRSENKEPSVILGPYLAEMIDEINGRKLEIDFTNLEYINSSTVLPIIQMLKYLHLKKVSTKIYYDKVSKWQSASFKALEAISKAMPGIEVIGK